jgi:hypothetical protein
MSERVFKRFLNGGPGLRPRFTFSPSFGNAGACRVKRYSPLAIFPVGSFLHAHRLAALLPQG